MFTDNSCQTMLLEVIAGTGVLFKSSFLCAWSVCICVSTCVCVCVCIFSLFENLLVDHSFE